MGTDYWNSIQKSFSSIWKGMRITFRHARSANHTQAQGGIQSANYFEQSDGLMTLQYPHESLPVPDNGRYRLHNEMDDCIVCDKCAKVCPVDCIEIEPIKAKEVYGTTSDGTPKRIHAARFDIDMGKCCFCGLCTTVCPTECLTMTKAYDFSEYDVIDHIYSFGTMSDEQIAEKRKEAEDSARPSDSMDTPTASAGPSEKTPGKKPGKPMMPRPSIRPRKRDE